VCHSCAHKGRRLLGNRTGARLPYAAHKTGRINKYSSNGHGIMCWDHRETTLHCRHAAFRGCWLLRRLRVRPLLLNTPGDHRLHCIFTTRYIY
jgi:hypothetical protein